jgi:hypothetical protein
LKGDSYGDDSGDTESHDICISLIHVCRSILNLGVPRFYTISDVFDALAASAVWIGSGRHGSGTYFPFCGVRLKQAKISKSCRPFSCGTKWDTMKQNRRFAKLGGIWSEDDLRPM